MYLDKIFYFGTLCHVALWVTAPFAKCDEVIFEGCERYHLHIVSAGLFLIITCLFVYFKRSLSTRDCSFWVHFTITFSAVLSALGMFISLFFPFIIAFFYRKAEERESAEFDRMTREGQRDMEDA